MTSAEVTLLTTHVVDALKPHIEQLVSVAVAEIPYQIRERLNPFVDKEIERYIQARIEACVRVDLKPKGGSS